MALRAGYYGLKNSVKRTLEKLASDMAGAKAIKSVGDGLSLSDQGALAANIDTETMEFKDHKLAAKSSSRFTMDQIYYNNGDPAATGTDVSIIEGKHFSDYDMLILDIGQVSDGGISAANGSCNQKCLWLADPALAISGKWICGDYYQRSISVLVDVEHDTFSYTSAASSEQSGYAMRIYAIQGVKF